MTIVPGAAAKVCREGGVIQDLGGDRQSRDLLSSEEGYCTVLHSDAIKAWGGTEWEGVRIG